MSSSDIVAHSMLSNPSCLTSADGDDATHMKREKMTHTNQHGRSINRWTKRPKAQSESGQTVESIPTPSFLRKNEQRVGDDTLVARQTLSLIYQRISRYPIATHTHTLGRLSRILWSDDNGAETFWREFTNTCNDADMPLDDRRIRDLLYSQTKEIRRT